MLTIYYNFSTSILLWMRIFFFAQNYDASIGKIIRCDLLDR